MAADWTFSFPELANMVITISAMIGAIGVIGRFAMPSILKLFKIDAMPSDVLTEVAAIKEMMGHDHVEIGQCRCLEEFAQVFKNQKAFSDAISVLIHELVPPNTAEIREAYETLRRAGLANGVPEDVVVDEP